MAVKDRKNILPLDVLMMSVKRLPSMKYALGVAGIFSVLAIAQLFNMNLRAAIVGSLLIVPVMFILLLFAKISGRSDAGYLKIPALFLTWGYVIIILAVTVMIFTSLVFRWPISDFSFIDQKSNLNANVHGEVRDVAGNPIVDAKVTIDATPFSAASNELGRYRGVLKSIEPGELVHIRFYKSGYFSNTIDTTLESKELNVSATLRKVEK